MSGAAVTVVDYGIGNIFSVSRALERCGVEVRYASDAQGVLAADRLVLPGVGAFINGMEGLHSRGLVEPLREYARSGKPLLGICLGMQMLFDTSSEFGTHRGLGIIPGRVDHVGVPRDPSGAPLKVPHIGWSDLDLPEQRSGWSGTILSRLTPGEQCYFVHSYTAIPAVEADRLADTLYGGVRISAAVGSGNVFGCQFHPEKSGTTGLKIIEAFMEL